MGLTWTSKVKVIETKGLGLKVFRACRAYPLSMAVRGKFASV